MKTLMVPIEPSELKEAFSAIEDVPVTANDEEVLQAIEKKMDLNSRIFALRIAARIQAVSLFANQLAGMASNHITYGDTGHVEQVSDSFAEIAASAPLVSHEKVFMFKDPNMIVAWLMTPFGSIAHG